jgi:SH3-like domain-containing protein
VRWRGAQWLAAAAMLLTAASGRAATAYVTDELILNVYSDQNQQGQRLATLHSGASVETLAASADYTQVRLGDGVTGWVKSTFLTTNVPATVRVKQLEEELDRSRATTPALAEAAARSEMERLQHELSDTQSQLAEALSTRGESPAAGAAAGGAAPPAARRSIGVGTAAIAMLAVAALGFWVGYATLARRIRRKFGGLKVY